MKSRPATGVGKIARLPRDIRRRVGVALRDGAPAKAILGEIHADPRVVAVLNQWFSGKKISPQNLTNWKDSADYREFIDQEEKTELTRALAEWSADLANAAGSAIGSGLSAVVAGKIYEQLEHCDPDNLGKLMESLARHRGMDIAEAKQRLDTRKVELKDREVALAEEKFQVLACEKIAEWAKRPEVQAILGTHSDRGTQIAELRRLVFG